jgi:hypothetical protein
MHWSALLRSERNICHDQAWLKLLGFYKNLAIWIDNPR